MAHYSQFQHEAEVVLHANSRFVVAEAAHSRGEDGFHYVCLTQCAFCPARRSRLGCGSQSWLTQCAEGSTVVR